MTQRERDLEAIDHRIMQARDNMRSALDRGNFRVAEQCMDQISALNRLKEAAAA